MAPVPPGGSSPEGAAGRAAPAGGEGKAARPAGVPPASSAAPSSESFRERWRTRWACRRLDRLARDLGRIGWVSAPRYSNSPPELLVRASLTSSIGDTVSVVRGERLWWYRSSTGAWLGPCYAPSRAAETLGELLRSWGIRPGIE